MKKNTSAKSSKKGASSTSTSGAATILGGLAVAAAIGGYFIYNNKNTQTKIKKVKGWALKAKGEVLEKVEKLREVNETSYHGIVDGVLSRYQKLSNIDASEIIQISKELKSHWKSIQKDLKDGSKKVSQVVKKVVDASIDNKGTTKKSSKSK